MAQLGCDGGSHRALRWDSLPNYACRAPVKMVRSDSHGVRHVLRPCVNGGEILAAWKRADASKVSWANWALSPHQG